MAILALAASVASVISPVVTPVAAAALPTPVAGEYVAVTPYRLVDTRSGLGVPVGRIGQGQTASFGVLGTGGATGVPSSGVSAVAVTVTAVGPSATSWLTVFARGEPRPGVSQLSFPAGWTIANTVISKLGASGGMSVYNSVGTVDLVVDVQGYYTSSTAASSGATFVAVTPQRIYDTRTGVGGSTTPIGPGQTRLVQVLGQGGVPATGVSSVVVNVTVANATASTAVSTWGGGPLPGTTMLNAPAGTSLGALVTSKVDASGRISIHNSAGSAHLVVDVEGYYLPPTQVPASVFVPITPTRVFSTTAGLNTSQGPLAGGSTASALIRGVTVGGTVVVPDSQDISSVVLSVTAVAPAAAGNLQVFPDGVPPPGTSVVNFPAGSTMTGTVIAKIGVNGRVAVQLQSAGSAGLLVDVQGYFQDVDEPPAVPEDLAVAPCESPCPAAAMVSTSLNPDLSAELSDPDSLGLEGLFEVRKQGETQLVASGSDLVTSGATAVYTVPPGDLSDGGSYQFRVAAKDAQSTTWSAWVPFTVRVDTTAPGTSLKLAEPLVIWDDGPELSWTRYKDPSSSTADDLVSYQVFRGCVTLPGEDGCPSPFGPDYSTDPSSDPELVATVDPDQTTWTDESAAASSTTTAAGYYYWIGARTVADVAAQRDNAQVASNSQKVTTPRQGRVRRILTGDLADTTLSQAQPDAVLGTPDNATSTAGAWLQVGNNHPTYGTERAVMAFDTSAVQAGLTVTDARLELHQVGGSGSGAPLELRELTKSFDEDQATWRNATSTIPWANQGGDLTATALATLTTDSTAKVLTIAGTAGQVRAAVQGWVNDQPSNHGLALTTSGTSPQQWLNLAASEATDPATRPRLVVEHLKNTAGETFVATQTPERLLPNTVTTVPVTVTNTTALDWPAGLQLSYRWTQVGQSADEAPANSDKVVALGRALAPGESVTVNLTLRAPINAATGEKLKLYDLQLDLLNNGAWWSATHPYTTAVLTAEQRTQRLCTVVATGLLCPNRVVDSEKSTMLGLEKFYSYAGEATGAGSALLTNLATGNVVWSYDAMQNPSVGPSMFTRVVYNSQDATSDTGPGPDWSVQVATLSRLGSPLVVAGNNKSVTLIDGDGTEHIWLQDAAKSTPTTLAYTRPPGVALELTGAVAPTDPDKAWVFTRPDGTKFHYGTSLRPTSVVDMNGNALAYTYNGSGRLVSVTDAKGRVVAELGWNSTELVWVKDISGRALKFTHNTAGQLTALEDGGGFNTSTKTFTGQVKKFTFAYTTNQPNSALLNQITDPRRVASDPAQDQTTTVDYYVANEDYGFPDLPGTAPSFVVGWPKLITDRMARTTRLRYYDADGSDGNNISAKVTDNHSGDSALNETTTYRVDGYGRTVSVQDASANETQLGWDADHNVVRLEEANGAVSRWLFHPVTGYPLKVWDAEAVRTGGAPQTLTYGTVGTATVLTQIETPSGKVTTFGHDAKANLTSVTDPLGNLTSYTYNTDGTQATATDARRGAEHTTTFEYDPLKGAKAGSPTRITPPPGMAATDFVYDVRGNVTSTTQAAAPVTLVTTAIYDEFGRPTSVTTPGAQGGARTTTTVYDLNDNVTSSTAPNQAIVTTQYLPDDQPKLTTVPANNSTAARTQTFSYDPMGRLASTTSPQGNRTATASDLVTKYAYDRLGQVLSVEQPLAGPTGETAVTTYSYDHVGNVIKVLDPRGKATSMVYDVNHRPTATIDAVGYATRTRYDADGQVIAQIDQSGNPKTYAYDDAGRVKSVTVKHTPTGQATQTWVTEYEYDAVGNQTKVIRPHLAGATQPLFEETRFDAHGQVTQTRAAFDPNHGTVRYRTPAVTYFTYDNLGRISRQSAPTRAGSGQEWTDLTYYDSGDVKSSTDPWGISTTYEYDSLGSQTKRVLKGATGTATRTMSWTYHPDGSLASRADAAPTSVAVTVDNTDTDDAVVTGTWATATTAVGKVGVDYRTHAAAAVGSPGAADRVTWNLSAAQTGQYRIEVSCPTQAGASSAAVYTVTGATGAGTVTLNQQTCSDAQTWHSLGTYDLTGTQLVTVALKPSATGTVVADAIRIVPLDTDRAFTYEYDADGRPTRVNDQTPRAKVDAYTTTYDNVGRVSDVKEMVGATAQRTTSYTYDIASNPLTVTANRVAAPSADDRGNLPSTQYTKYAWDSRNLVESVIAGKSSADARTWTYTYDPRGMKSTWTKPGPNAETPGNVTTYAYHESGLPRSIVERTAADVLVASHQLWFNPDADRTRDLSRVDNAETTGYLDQTADYTYTPARQLAKVTKTGAHKSKNEDYLYDDAGNIDNQTVDGKVTNFTYDRNRLTTSTTAGDTSTHNYDAFGRLNTVTGAGTVLNKYTYDGFDHLVQEIQTIPGTSKVTTATAYDPFDRTTLRTTKIGTGPAKKTRFNYLGMTEQVTLEEQFVATAWQPAKTYQYGPEGRPLLLEDTPVEGAAPDKTHLYGVNPHGDTETLTDPSTGRSTATYRYTAYGATDKIGTTGADKPGTQAEDADQVNPYRYNSKRFDAATNKYDMGFRDYDPGLNRFLSRDMYNGALNDLALGTDPWNTNRYAFAGGNPIAGIELDGHRAVNEDGSPIAMGDYQPMAHRDHAASPTGQGSQPTGAHRLGEGVPVHCYSGGRCGVVSGQGDSPPQAPLFERIFGELALAGCSWAPGVGVGCDAYDAKRTVDEDGVGSWSFLGAAAGFFPLGDIFKAPKQLDNVHDAANSADNVVNGVRLRAQLTGQEISGGHAFQKHVIDQAEFPGITTRSQFAAHIEDVVMNGEMRTLGGGRTAFWRDGTVVIRNPRAPDGGTAFVPTDGYDYFLNQLH